MLCSSGAKKDIAGRCRKSGHSYAIAVSISSNAMALTALRHIADCLLHSFLLMVRSLKSGATGNVTPGVSLTMTYHVVSHMSSKIRSLFRNCSSVAHTGDDIAEEGTEHSDRGNIPTEARPRGLRQNADRHTYTWDHVYTF